MTHKHGNTLAKIVDGFPRLTVSVLADLVADEFVFGEISRVSREAPVLILKHRERTVVPGGGANAICNLAALEVNEYFAKTTEKSRTRVPQYRRVGDDYAETVVGERGSVRDGGGDEAAGVGALAGHGQRGRTECWERTELRTSGIC